MLTPVTETGEPAFDQLEKLTDLLINEGMDGLYLLGSTGQGVLFTEKQRKQVVETAVRVNAGRVPLMVQVGALTTAESIRLAEHAASCGADAISSVGPIYFTGTAKNALEHYRQIATATNLPFFPYQLGNNTMGDIKAFIDELLEIPQVVGMKLTTGQLLEIGAIHQHAGGRLRLFSGADELYCHASLCGTIGAIGTFYNLWGATCKRVYHQFRLGNYDLAKTFMLTFQEIILYVLPNIWTFLHQAMKHKHNIDIGQTKPPLGTLQASWEDAEVIKIIDRIEAVAALNN